MRKSFVAIVAVALVAALAVPAMAEVNLTGFYRAKGYLTNFYNGGAGDVSTKAQLSNDPATKAYVDQRLRTKFTAGDENVKAVLFLENDMQWGSVASPAGDLAADETNLEVKNAYVWFKVPNTTVDVTVGMQGLADAYAGIFSGAADVAGIVANYRPAETFALKLAFAQPYNTNVSQDDSVNLWMAEAKFLATKDVKVGANLYFLRDASDGVLNTPSTYQAGTDYAQQEGITKLYMPGVDFTANLGAASLTGYAFAQFGDREYVDGVTAKTKFGGFAADLRVDAAAGIAKVYAEGLYVSGDSDSNIDNPAGNKYKGVVVLDDYRFAAGCSTCGRWGTYLILPANDSINTAQGLSYDVNNHGYGLLFFQAGASAELMPKLTGKFNAAYAMAAKDNVAGDKDMGIELNATAEYNLQKGLDVSATAAYAFVGDFYGTDNDDPYALIAKVNYAF